MFIHFKEIRYQNFLATGNDFTRIKLDKTSSTLITGANGAGKSTIIEALTYALYGNPYRKINKPQLINSMTKKNMLVEVDFAIGKKNYMVRRGMAPGIFEIYENGSMLKQDSKSTDYQKEFVRNILRIQERAFRQVIVLGSANYTPFMQLPTGSRRQIVEDFLDINIFTVMNALLKDEMSTLKGEIQRLDAELRIIENKVELTKKHIQSLKQNNADLIKERKRKINEYSKDIDSNTKDAQRIQEDIATKQSSIEDLDRISRRLKKLQDAKTTGKDKINKFDKEISFYHNYDDCPTCRQGISHDFKTSTILKRETKKQEFSDILEKIDAEYSDLNVRMAEITAIQKEITELNQKFFLTNQNISHLNRMISDLESEIEKLEKKQEDIQNDHEDLKTILLDKKKAERAKEKALGQQPIHEVCSTMLKDSGIKTKIIRQYVPIMNKLINKYLAEMDFFCDFEFDESFNEKIKSRGRDDFTYNSFSEGEKQRLNLAILFTWRSIAKQKSSLSTNLLFLDETFDSSTDAMGVDSIMSILTTEFRDSNVFIISHNEKLYDKFHSVIHFAKEKGFSKIYEGKKE